MSCILSALATNHDKRPLADRAISADVVAADALTVEHLTAWRRIIAQNAEFDSPFFSPEFTRATAEARPYVYVAVFREAGAIRAILPYQFATVWQRLLGAAERIGGEMSDYFGLIAESGFQIDVPSLMRFCRLHTLTFTHMDASQSRLGLEGERPEAGLRIQLARGPAHYWKELARTDKRLVSDTDRRLRKLVEAHGPIRFELDAHDRSAELERLTAMKRAQYGRTGVHDALAAPWARNLLSGLCSETGADCRGQLSVLFAGDTWVASHFGLRTRHVLHYWFPVYNPEMSQFSPGRLMLKHIIDSAETAGITLIDRGAGTQQAKRDFANESHQYVRGVWRSRSVQSFLYRVGQSLAWRCGQMMDARRRVNS